MDPNFESGGSSTPPTPPIGAQWQSPTSQTPASPPLMPPMADHTGTYPSVADQTANDQPWPAAVEPPRPSRRRMWIGLGVAALLVGGATATFLALRGGETKQTFSLDAAVDVAQQTSDVTYETKIDVMIVGISAEMTVNGDAQLIRMSMDLSALSELGGDELSGMPESMVMLIDLESGDALLDKSLLGDEADFDEQWIRVSPEDADAFGDIDQMTSNNPIGITALFDEASEVREIGFDEVDGEKVKHFRLTVDFDDVLQLGGTQFDDLDSMDIDEADLPDEIDYDVYVNEDNQIRRIVFEAPIGGLDLGIDMTVIAFGDEVERLERPAEDDIIDQSEVPGF